MPAITDSSASAHWIDGAWSPPGGTGTIEVLNPATEEPIGAAPAGTTADVARAVAAAAAAFPGWADTPLAERVAMLERWHQQLSARADQLAELVTDEVGTPLAVSRAAQVGFALAILAAYADAALEAAPEERVGGSLVLREPAGVAACIVPWNLPLIILMQKLPAALAAGCTVVLKPSEVTPLNVTPVVEAAEQAGFPAGVLNVVYGDGPTVGEALVSHPDVNVVSFTGSTRAGRRVAALAADTVKRVHLELGGNSASVLLDDADLQPAVRASVEHAFFNCGQSCIAWSRLLVPNGRHEEAAALAGSLIEGYRVGHPRDPDTHLGPLVSAAARERVTGYIRGAVDEGARLVVGGAERQLGSERGYYVAPTVFADVHPRMTIAQEEVFGPMIAVMPYSDGDDDEAVRIANDTRYGLHGAVWSGDEKRALRIARRMRTGRVDVNGAPFNMASPFGGYGQSGVGRELGRYGIEEFLEHKSVQVPWL